MERFVPLIPVFAPVSSRDLPFISIREYLSKRFAFPSIIFSFSLLSALSLVFFLLFFLDTRVKITRFRSYDFSTLTFPIFCLGEKSVKKINYTQ